MEGRYFYRRRHSVTAEYSRSSRGELERIEISMRSFRLSMESDSAAYCSTGYELATGQVHRITYIPQGPPRTSYQVTP